MGRKKKSRFPRFILSKKAISNILGLILVLLAFIMLGSFSQLFAPSEEGQLLKEINSEMIRLFGGLSIFSPIILLLFAGHLFSSKKFQFVRLNLTAGAILLFVTLLGLFKAGIWGQTIYENLTTDFTVLGALSILIIFFVIGFILFLDTSVDVIMVSFVKFFKAFSSLFVNTAKKVALPKTSQKEEQVKKDDKDNFISDQVIINKPAAHPVINQSKSESLKEVRTEVVNGLSIKPVAQSDSSTWVYPPITLLNEIKQSEADRGDVNGNAKKIESTLESFGMRTRVKEINFGPTVTQYAIEITMGTKLSKITALSNDLALALAAPTGQVRIEAPIPGRSLVGIEIPNVSPQIVSLRQLMKSGDLGKKGGDPLLVPLGFDVAGLPVTASISKMPHVLVAGTTGSGKSVMLNAWITTLMMRTRPDELRMILVDPKQVEMVQYNGSPHLLTEVINDPAKVVSALRWSVAEMEARYKELASVGARNLEAFNKMDNVTPKPYIVFVIDELADLMMYAANDVEDMITRIAQKARAVGIHLVLATQRPSVDVITGLMKANIPSRIAFNVSSMVDSRVIIDSPGAEKLLGKGDMFYLPPDQAKPRRIQGPYLTDNEVGDVVKFLKSQVPEVHYTEEITDQAQQQSRLGFGAIMGGGQGANDMRDEYFEVAKQLISQTDKASASLLQRKLKIGYARAARILDELHEAGFVGIAQGSKPRDVIKEAFSQIQ
jgi:S-DNA-T family DNA segregation ATPase FtsK/SpoIIIE